MKQKISIIIATFVILLSCRSDDYELQQIDQVLNLYMKNASGQDLLNSKVQGSYTSVALLDLLAETDLKSFSSYSLMKNADTVTYLNYLAGATRLLQDSISPTDKTYYSQFVIRLSKTENDKIVAIDDTIKIEYQWSPSVFKLSKFWYNQQLQSIKQDSQANRVTIVK